MYNTKYRLKPYIQCAPLWLLVLIATIGVSNNFFFWDTVQLGAHHGLFFYENGFASLLLPDEMDSGHPPLFGYYLALAWTLFGKSLAVSHLAMLPFLWGIIWQGYHLGVKFLGENRVLIFPIALICNPIMAGQGTLMSPDVVLAFFFLMALNQIFAKKELWLSLALLGLAMVSMRGMMVCGMLFIFDWLWMQEKAKWKPSSFFRVVRPYLLGGVAAFVFLVYHYVHKGWIGYHSGSPWAPAFELVGLKDFARNVAVLIWRLLDFGHVFVFAVIIYVGTQLKKSTIQKETLTLFVLLSLSVLLLTPTLLMYKGLLAHRYFLPIYLLITLLALRAISNLFSERSKNICFALVLVSLATGNLWIYQQPISTSWDSTLAHLPYYHLQREMVKFVDAQDIDHKLIGSAYPNLRPTKQTHLSNVQADDSFVPYDLDKNEYIFYSNVYNDFTPEQLSTLKNRWKVVKRLAYPALLGNGDMVEVVLYKKQ